MELLNREGLVKSIGVCNFNKHHLINLLNVADITPAVNQIELHPLLSQPHLVNFCKEAGIQVEAYSPFARMHEKLIKNKLLVSIANHHQKTVPQIILRWNFQHGVVSVPKASSTTKLKENICISDFDLSVEEMKSLDLLNIDFRVRYDPDYCDFDKL